MGTSEWIMPDGKLDDRRDHRPVAWINQVDSMVHPGRVRVRRIGCARHGCSVSCRPDADVDSLTAQDDLVVALHSIDDFGRSIQGADTKAGAFAAVLGLMLGSLVNDIADGRAVLLASANLHGAAGITFLVFMICMVGSGVALGLTQVPRLRTAVGRSRLAFPSFAKGGDWAPAVTRGRLNDEAWRQAEVLAGIAMTKFKYLRVALITTGVSVLGFLAWLVLCSIGH